MEDAPPPYTIPCDTPMYPNRPCQPPPAAPAPPINPAAPPTCTYPTPPTVVQQAPPAVVPIVMQQQQQQAAPTPASGASAPNIIVNTNAVGGGGGVSDGACRIAAISCPICKIGVIVTRRNPLLFWLTVCLSFSLPPISLCLCFLLCTDLVREEACTACRYRSGFHLF